MLRFTAVFFGYGIEFAFGPAVDEEVLEENVVLSETERADQDGTPELKARKRVGFAP